MVAAAANIDFAHAGRDSKYVSGFSRLILKDAMTKAAVSSIVITSTYRSEEDQARIMLLNLKPGPGSMYAGAGRQVEVVGKQFAAEREAIQQGLAKGFNPNTPLPRFSQSEEDVTCAMALRIHQLERHKGVGCVSHHQKNPKLVNVIDIDPAHIVPHGHLIKFIKALTNSPSVNRIGLPGGVMSFSHKHFRESVRCLHVEIPQPGDFPETGSSVA